MKFDPIVFNALKKEQNDLAGVIVQDLQDKILFNSQPIDNRVVDLHAIPAIKNKMRWDYPGATYKFNLYAPVSATLIDGDSISYYTGMDFNPDDGYNDLPIQAIRYRRTCIVLLTRILEDH